MATPVGKKCSRCQSNFHCYVARKNNPATLYDSADYPKCECDVCDKMNFESQWALCRNARSGKSNTGNAKNKSSVFGGGDDDQPAPRQSSRAHVSAPKRDGEGMAGAMKHADPKDKEYVARKINPASVPKQCYCDICAMLSLYDDYDEGEGDDLDCDGPMVGGYNQCYDCGMNRHHRCYDARVQDPKGVSEHCGCELCLMKFDKQQKQAAAVEPPQKKARRAKAKSECKQQKKSKTAAFLQADDGLVEAVPLLPIAAVTQKPAAAAEHKDKQAPAAPAEPIRDAERNHFTDKTFSKWYNFAGKCANAKAAGELLAHLSKTVQSIKAAEVFAMFPPYIRDDGTTVELAVMACTDQRGWLRALSEKFPTTLVELNRCDNFDEPKPHFVTQHYKGGQVCCV